MRLIMDEKERSLRKSIGRKIKLARANAKYTQEQLSEKLSITPKYISQLERGISFGSAKTIVNICKELNISSAFLFDDLIDVDSPNELPPIDTDFLKTYIQLDDYNKDVLFLFAAQLLRLQDKKIGH